MVYVEGGYRPQNKEAAFNAGPQGRAPLDGGQIEMHFRTLLSQERERRSEGFNEAEFVREQLVNERRMWWNREHAGDRGALGWAIASQHLLDFFDAAAYDRYTSEDVQNRALVNLAGLEDRQHINLKSFSRPEWFGAMARVLDLPYTPGQTVISTSPAALAELRELGVEDGKSYRIPVTLLAKARKMNDLERRQPHEVFTKSG